MTIALLCSPFILGAQRLNCLVLPFPRAMAWEQGTGEKKRGRVGEKVEYWNHVRQSFVFSSVPFPSFWKVSGGTCNIPPSHVAVTQVCPTATPVWWTPWLPGCRIAVKQSMAVIWFAEIETNLGPILKESIFFWSLNCNVLGWWLLFSR